MQLIISLTLGAVVLLGLIAARVTLSEGRLADEKLQELSRKSVESQESERSRVARQLQSLVMKALNLSNSNLRSLAKSDKFNDSDSRESFIMATKALHSAMKDIRNISGELRPAIRDKMGLNAAIQELVNEQVTHHPHINVSYKASEIPERLNSDIEIVLFRIVQSALTNVNEHSGANNVNIRIGTQGRKVLLSIQDNGVGFNVKKVTGKSSKVGIGLIDMRIRAESLGGSFQVFSTANIGTHIKVEIPR